MPRSDILARFEQHGVHPTPQRLEVAAVLLNRPQHLSADQLIAKLRDSGSSVSKATVYNSLNIFVKNGLVRECRVAGERRVYDSNTTAHHHFYNADTGELLDIPAATVAISGLPAMPKGTTLESAELIVRIRNTAK